MKYMGSKRLMLTNGLGEAIIAEAARSHRVVDLFTGSGAVAWFAAEHTDTAVHAVDLQDFAVILARAVVGRTRRVNIKYLEQSWLVPSRTAARRSRLWQASAVGSDAAPLSRRDVLAARALCNGNTNRAPIWSAYGGHYYSPRQALQLDAALRRLPDDEPERAVCHAALISAASYCAAAPGHTAQPFQPTRTALPFIRSAWQSDPIEVIRTALKDIGARVAAKRGSAKVADAVAVARSLKPTDLAIVDPPYSAVQYSRFYHVLETIARVENVDVSGVGRYPPYEARPRSAFSLKTESEGALKKLLGALANTGCRVLLTFPAGASSNGLSGAAIIRVARTWYDVETRTVLGRFSTLGGNNMVRASRTHSAEMILSMVPRE
jgi:adenine-specific DNA methylase